MPFLAEEHIAIPSTDLLSWMFDNQTYDADNPVITAMEHLTRSQLIVADLRRCSATCTIHLLQPGKKYSQEALCWLQIDWAEAGRLCMHALFQ